MPSDLKARFAKMQASAAASKAKATAAATPAADPPATSKKRKEPPAATAPVSNPASLPKKTKKVPEAPVPSAAPALTVPVKPLVGEKKLPKHVHRAATEIQAAADDIAAEKGGKVSGKAGNVKAGAPGHANDGKRKGKSAQKVEDESARVPATISRPIPKNTFQSSKKKTKVPSPSPPPASSDASGEEEAENEAAATSSAASGSDAENSDSAAHLHGFSTDEDDDSSDEEVGGAPAIDVASLPTVAKDDATVRQKLERAKREKTEERGVLYLGRIPHGFYEAEMRQYFSQFGDITRLRLSRNKRTGASRHYAFIEFASVAVAQIVAETMDNYLLMGHILRCRVVPQKEVHSELWVGANRRWRRVPVERIVRVRHNKARTEDEREKAEARLLQRQEERKRKLKEAGIEYDFEEVAYKKKKPAVKA